MCEPGERSEAVGGGVEDQLRPLRTARVLKRDCVHSRARQRLGQRQHHLHRRPARLEWADPGVTFDVPRDDARLEEAARRECRTPNHVADVLGDGLLVADPVLH